MIQIIWIYKARIFILFTHIYDLKWIMQNVVFLCKTINVGLGSESDLTSYLWDFIPNMR